MEFFKNRKKLLKEWKYRKNCKIEELYIVSCEFLINDITANIGKWWSKNERIKLCELSLVKFFFKKKICLKFGLTIIK